MKALLAVAREDEQRVVDPEREPHPGEHVGGEDRERKGLPDERRERERDHDRDDRQQQRDSRHHGAEDDQQHDERSRQPESQLAVLQVLLRQRREVGVEGVLAGDRGIELVSTIGALHGLDDALDVVLRIAAEGHEHPRGITIPETSRRSPES